jgi:hypothetical protein
MFKWNSKQNIAVALLLAMHDSNHNVHISFSTLQESYKAIGHFKNRAQQGTSQYRTHWVCWNFAIANTESVLELRVSKYIKCIGMELRNNKGSNYVGTFTEHISCV